MHKTPLLGDNKLLSSLRSLNELGEGTREAEVIRPVEHECPQKPLPIVLSSKPLSWDKSRSGRVKVIPL